MAKESLAQLHKRALDFVLNTYASYEKRSETEDKWTLSDKLYNCLGGKHTYDGVANLFPPATRRAVRSLLNFCDESIFGKSPNFTIKGIGGENDEKRAKINEKIIAVQLEKINFRTKATFWRSSSSGSSSITVGLRSSSVEVTKPAGLFRMQTTSLWRTTGSPSISIIAVSDTFSEAFLTIRPSTVIRPRLARRSHSLREHTPASLIILSSLSIAINQEECSFCGTPQRTS